MGKIHFSIRFSLLLVVLATVLFLLSSCLARQTLNIAPNGSGTCTITISLNPEFVDYALDLGEAAGYFPNRDTAALFDQTEIRKSFAGLQDISLNSLQSDGKKNISIAFSFSNIQTLLTSHEFFRKTGLIRYSTTGNTTNISVAFNNTLVHIFFEEILGLSREEYEYLLPQPGESRASWYEALDFSMENGRAIVQSSFVSVDVTVPGTIQSHNGADQGKNCIRFSQSLENILFAKESTTWNLVYRQ